MEKQHKYQKFLYGVVYYPEQWPEELWDSDYLRISQTGMNVVRMGEGAWSFWEPDEIPAYDVFFLAEAHNS
jgi:beta-galactosidase